jgi:ADP-ribose pyrophosphatase YjhB (NUDIX family)
MTIGMGHNSGEHWLDDEIEANRREFEFELTQRVEEAGRVICSTEEEAGRAVALVKVFIELAKAIDKKRAEIKAPVLAASRKIDDTFGPLVTRAKAAQKGVLDLVDGFRRAQEAAAAERKRQLEEEARLKAAAAAEAQAAGDRIAAAALVAETQEAAAAAVAAGKFEITSEYGPKAAKRIAWKHEITDLREATLAMMEDKNVMDAVDAAIAKAIRAGARSIPGVRVFSTETTVVR